MKKILIAYFSRKGQNYSNGNIVNLAVGNTEAAAQKIKSLVGGDFFHIDTVKPYPKDYMQTTEVAKKELKDNARPELNAKVENMDEYDTVILGYPNWWGTMPMAVHNFLESYDFSEKTIVPFCTHEGSRMGHSEADIKKLCPKSNILKGLAIHGSSVASSDSDIEKWLKKLNIVK